MPLSLKSQWPGYLCESLLLGDANRWTDTRATNCDYSFASKKRPRVSKHLENNTAPQVCQGVIG